MSVKQEQISVNEEELTRLINNKKESLLLFDLRTKEEFVNGHIGGSVNAVCDAYAKENIIPRIPKIGKMVLLCQDGTISEPTAKMMRSYGFDAYFLEGGMKNWQGELEIKSFEPTISVNQLWESILQKNEVLLIDVRPKEDFSSFKIPGSINMPLAELFNSETVDRLPKDKQLVTVCPRGNMSMVGVFALARNGISAKGLTGGLSAWGQLITSSELFHNGLNIFQIKKIGKGCISYILSSQKEAVVIDPVYPLEEYIKIASQRDLKISVVMDTHLHADHVSAARELAKITGAQLMLSEVENYEFSFNKLNNDNRIKFGGSEIKVIHTPGHTPGSISYLLDGKYLFSGDTVFAEGIGRPDLRDKAREFANDLYDTLHLLLQLPGDVNVLPGHYSNDEYLTKSVGTNIDKIRTFSILNLNKQEFVDKVVGIEMPKPMNYEKIIMINKGSEAIDRTNIPYLELGPNRCAIAAY